VTERDYQILPDRQLPDEVIDGLSPGIRELVIWLNAMGFETSDSGDGSNAAAGMECALEMPMVAIPVPSAKLISESIRLKERLEARGVDFTKAVKVDCDEGTEGVAWPIIQATYDPVDESSLIVLMNMLSTHAGL
jgi:hypothetical protein